MTVYTEGELLVAWCPICHSHVTHEVVYVDGATGETWAVCCVCGEENLDIP